MSVQATSWVWEHSESAGNARLVLLAIADHADRFGGNAWPSQATLADVCRLSVRTVRRLVAELVILGELEVVEHGGQSYRDDRRPHLYRLAKMPGGTGGHPDRSSQNGRTSERHGRTSGTPRADTVVRQTILLDPPSKNPSGGSPAGSDATKEATMNPADPLALFEVDAPEPEQQPRAPGAQDVVAAYVDSYRKHHSGGNPSRSDIGRVARDAKRALEAGQAGPVELTAAAAAMGSGPYANLSTQLNMLRERGSRSPHYGRIAPVAPREMFEEGARVSHLKFLAEIKSDPEVAAWVAEDPEAMATYIAEDPSLEAAFAPFISAVAS